MLPNGSLSNSSIVNVGAENTRRIDIQIGIGYSSDIPKAKKLLEQVINSEQGILKDKDIMVVVKSLDESCVTLETYEVVFLINIYSLSKGCPGKYMPSGRPFYNFFTIFFMLNTCIIGLFIIL